LGTVGGVAYPGFDDFYVQGGVGDIIPFDIPHNGGQTLDDVLNVVAMNTSRMDFLQLATFNDFGEGTIFEPTLETGFEYLVRIQDFTGTPYGEAELQLVYRLYLARKKYAGDVSVDVQLDQVAANLAALQIEAASALLDSAAPTGDYDADGDVDDADYNVWRAAYGAATILHGSGADGNYDGSINAADYTVWRNSLGEGGNGSNNTPVPEPSTWRPLVLALMGALAWRPVSCRRPTRVVEPAIASRRRLATTDLPASSAFRSLEEPSSFFRSGSRGDYAASNPGRFQGWSKPYWPNSYKIGLRSAK
jgi:hypothetical protein